MSRLLLLLFLLTSAHLKAQPLLESATAPNKKRLIGVSATGAALWGGSISALYFVWYKNFEKSSFHFFDDSHEWNQMDKMGHLYTSWHFARLTSDLYQWSGLDHKKSALIGAGYSLGYMTTFEILDAYNTEWGFSWSDIGFNALGTGTFFIQEYLWNEQYAQFKFSYHHTELAQYRPSVLGQNFSNRLLKDYNGQTYWMSFNPLEWFHTSTSFPKWINLSIGYGTQDQLIGNGNTYTVISDNGTQLNFTPYRQYFLSLDINFEKIPTQSRFLKLVFRGLNTLKVPFPTLEFSNNQIRFHPLYF